MRKSKDGSDLAFLAVGFFKIRGELRVGAPIEVYGN
jgi:hypothetical protein